jgi:methionyl-tRNA synthetase
VTRCGTVIAVLLNLIKLLAALLNPYIPATSDKIYAQLNTKPALIPDTFALDLPVGHEIGEPAVLFKKLEQAQVDVLKAKFGGGEVKKEAFVADIRGGVIANVQDHPNDENLYVVSVDIGKEKRQAVARLKAVYKKEELVGRQVAILCNLPRADFKGATSEGMLLVSESKKGGMVLLQPTAQVPDWAGKQIIPEGTILEVSEKPITLKEFQKMDLRLTKESKVTYKQKFLLKAGDKNNVIELHAPGVEGGAKIK